MFDVTKHGLGHWYKHEFEHLGWMVLAKRESLENESAELKEHMAKKVNLYCESIQNLIMALEEKANKVADADEKADLLIMCKNAKSLKAFVSATLMGAGVQMGGKRRSKKSKKSKKASRK